MNYLKIFILPFTLIINFSISRSQTIMLPGGGYNENITVQYVDPLIKIFPEINTFPASVATADVAKGEYATFQYIVRSKMLLDNCTVEVKQGEFSSPSYSLVNNKNVKWGFVDYVRTGRTIRESPSDKLISPSGFFPDPIIDTTFIKLRRDYSQPVWVSINIPKDCPSGNYTGKFILKGKNGKREIREEREFTIQVYPVTIDSSSLYITNWFNMGASNLKLMNNNKDVEPYSERYWELLKVVAKKLKEFGQNTVLISPVSLTQYSMERGHYKFDFSRFDKYVQIFSDAGVLKRIEGGHIGGGGRGYGTPFEVSVPVITEGETRFKHFPINNEIAENFYREFIPGLIAHLKEKGWYNRYMQHIADEPNEKNYQSYVEIATFFKKMAPGIPIIDAVETKKLNDIVDIWVPLLSVLDKEYDYFLGRSYKNDELWTYICTNPKGEYANRFIELPLIKPRLVFWIMFKYQIKGYLHWGFNYWNDHPFYETVQLNTDWPAGDSYLVYPGYNKLYSSIRFDAQRDGIVDYELLQMLSKKNPEKAKEICGDIIQGFQRYNTDILAFRKNRKRILELLSE